MQLSRILNKARGAVNGFFLRTRQSTRTSAQPAASSTFVPWTFLTPIQSMKKPLLILYGSVTGNAEYCAEEAARYARLRGYDPTLESMACTDIGVLSLYQNLLLITSTYGDGDPPDGCEAFVEALIEQSVALPHLNFAVFALGDSAYEHFCKCGRDLDSALEKNGAHRLTAIVECDTEFDTLFEGWIGTTLNRLALNHLEQL